MLGSRLCTLLNRMKMYGLAREIVNIVMLKKIVWSYVKIVLVMHVLGGI